MCFTNIWVEAIIRTMENEAEDKKDQQGEGSEPDAYYREDDMEMGDLDLSFLDEEEDDEKDGTAK